MKVDSGFVCKICATSANIKSYLAKEMMFGTRVEFDYFQCSSCNCLQIVKIPKNISAYYAAENYYSFKKFCDKKNNGLGGYFNINIIRANALQDTNVRKLVPFIFFDRHSNFLGKVIKDFNTRILDVGCGNGYKFLYPLYESGFRNIAGCAPFIDSDITYENGLKITKNLLSEVQSEYEVICFNLSFEHIGNPLET